MTALWTRHINASLLGDQRLTRLAAALGVHRAEALGCVVSLWLWAMEHAPDGVVDIGPEAIERAADWEGERGLFVAMTTSERHRFLDVHEGQPMTIAGADWAEISKGLRALEAKREDSRERRRSTAGPPWVHRGATAEPPRSHRGATVEPKIEIEMEIQKEGEPADEPPAQPTLLDTTPTKTPAAEVRAAFDQLREGMREGHTELAKRCAARAVPVPTGVRIPRDLGDAVAAAIAKRLKAYPDLTLWRALGFVFACSHHNAGGTLPAQPGAAPWRADAVWLLTSGKGAQFERYVSEAQDHREGRWRPAQTVRAPAAPRTDPLARQDTTAAAAVARTQATGDAALQALEEAKRLATPPPARKLEA